MSREAVGALSMLGISFEALGIVELGNHLPHGFYGFLMRGILFVVVPILGTMA